MKLKKLKANYLNDSEIEIYEKHNLIEVIDRATLISKYNKCPNNLKRKKSIEFYIKGV